jgi:ketosteroid isomerase-like protein
MSEANKTVARRYYEELWEGNLGVADQIFAPRVTGHPVFINPVDTVTGLPVQGSDESTPEEEKAGVAVWLEELRGLHATVNEMLEDGDKVIALYTLRAANRTGNPVTVHGIDIFRIADGKIAEYWNSWDRLGFWQQMGVVPPTGELRAKAGVASPGQS